MVFKIEICSHHNLNILFFHDKAYDLIGSGTNFVYVNVIWLLVPNEILPNWNLKKNVDRYQPVINIMLCYGKGIEQELYKENLLLNEPCTNSQLSEDSNVLTQEWWVVWFECYFL